MTFGGYIQLTAAAASMILLIVAAVSDVARYRIPNTVVIGIVAAFALGAIGNFAWPAILWPVLAAAAMFLLGAGLFAAGLFGGGDVKLIAAMALWTGFADLPRFLLIMGAAGGLLGFAFLIKRQRTTSVANPAAHATSTAMPSEAAPALRKSRIPYGVAIAVGGFDFFLMSQHSPFAPLWPWMQ
ncbi:MAG TPA: prepilin peptidase [Vicinamibacterales bacterium]|nr:prepilin peptidase [Vicinamibacterales bacterium]